MSTTVKKLMQGIRVSTARTNKNSGTGHQKTSVTAHWWDDPGRRPSFEGTVSWLKRDSVQASVQCVAEAGRITYMERDDAAAWHCGNSAGNRGSWAIEINPRLSDGDYRTAAAAIARFWLERNSGNPTPILPHRHWNNVACPGHMDLRKLERYSLEALSGGNGGSSSSGGGGSSSSRKTDRQLAQEVIDGKHGNGAARQRSLGSRYAAVQREVNRILTGSSSGSVARKSVSQLATEVIRGEWGNEPQRSARLRNAGHNAQAVQREVNRRLR